MKIGRNAPCPCGAKYPSGAAKKFKVCCGASTLRANANAIDVQPLSKLQTVPVSGPGIILALPTRGSFSAETMICLLSRMDGVPHSFAFSIRQSVVDARNHLVDEIIALAKNATFLPKEWFVLWSDDDAWWPPGTVSRALAVMAQHPEVDMLAGWYCARREFSHAMCWRDALVETSYPVPGQDCTAQSLVEVEAVGFHWVIHRLSVLGKVGVDPFTPSAGRAEDAAFCDRAISAGCRIFAAAFLPIAHIDVADGSAYLPYARRMLSNGNGIHDPMEKSRSYGPEIDLVKLDDPYSIDRGSTVVLRRKAVALTKPVGASPAMTTRLR